MRSGKKKEKLVMTLDREIRAKELFCSALEMTALERKDYLAKACDDEKMLQEVLSLLASHEQASSFLEKDVAHLATKLVQKELSNILPFLKQIIGQVLDGKYLIEKQLGQGGMGTVYQAIHLGTKRPVALKIITPQFMIHAEFVERFKREAEAAGRLSHPNVVNVTDFGVTQGKAKVAYLVMEYLKGFTLGDLLKKKSKLPVGFTIDILEQICSAINEAHELGIIHRDLKPDNIWLEPDGRSSYHVKVLDFGLAKFHSNLSDSTTNDLSFISNPLPDVDSSPESLDTQAQPSTAANTLATGEQTFEEKDTKVLQLVETAKPVGSSPKTENMTRAGMILGTPLYMSPEQCKGVEIDSRSDIYSLGVIAYEMLTGEPPFRGTVKQLIHSHSEDVPTHINKKRKDVPKVIADLIMATLAKQPSDRFPSAQAFSTALQTNLAGEKPLLTQAFDIYKKHFPKVAIISVLINLFFVLFGSVLSILLTQHKFYFFYSSFLETICWISPLLFLVVLGEVSTGAFSLLVKQSQETDQVSLKVVLVNLVKNLPSLIRVTLQGYLLSLLQVWKLVIPTLHAQVEYSLSAPITFIEEKKGSQVMQRSKNLLKKFYSLAFSLKIRSLLIRVAAFILFLGSFMLTNIVFDNTTEQGFAARVLITIISTLLLPGLFLTIISPITDMAVTLLYFKSCEVNGENPYQHKSFADDLKLIERLTFSNKRKVLTAITLVLSVLFSAFSYILIVPPFSKPIEIVRPKFEKIPDSENAWVDYNLAIQDLLEISAVPTKENTNKTFNEVMGSLSMQQMRNPGFKDLETVATGKTEFNAEQLAYLDKHQVAIERVLAGAKRPKAQYYSELPTASTSMPNFIQIRSLIIVVCAQARRLHLEGKTAQGVELALAAYEMSIDIGADPNANLISGLISVVGSGIAYRTLFPIIYSGTTDAATDLEITRKIVELEQKIPNIHKTLTQDLQALHISLEEALIKNDPTELKGLATSFQYEKLMSALANLPGLRIRLHNELVTFNQNYLEQIRPSAETWDFPVAHSVASDLQETFSSWSLSPSALLARYLVSETLPSALSSMKSLYNRRCMGITLASFAAASAYKKTYGQFPATLDLAMKETNLAVPVDFATKKAIGYRLNNGNPEVWFAGADGYDNGGKEAYASRERDRNLEGKDHIFQYGKTPFVE
ncbi:MAG: serine/threonine protein kinase [Acidobacteria bacterium]|nr:serine/threonine protein kinase [Acidobacteriota bacterium]